MEIMHSLKQKLELVSTDLESIGNTVQVKLTESELMSGTIRNHMRTIYSRYESLTRMVLLNMRRVLIHMAMWSEEISKLKTTGRNTDAGVDPDE